MAVDNYVSDANDDDDSHDGDTDDADDVDDIQSERMAGCDGNMAADVPDGATNPLLPGNMTEGVVMIKMVMVMMIKMVMVMITKMTTKGKQRVETHPFGDTRGRVPEISPHCFFFSSEGIRSWWKNF